MPSESDARPLKREALQQVSIVALVRDVAPGEGHVTPAERVADAHGCLRGQVRTSRAQVEVIRDKPVTAAGDPAATDADQCITDMCLGRRVSAVRKPEV